MATIEVDENEFKDLQRLKATLGKMRVNKDALVYLQRAHKLIDPNAITAELDEIEAKSKEKSELQKSLDEIKAEIQADKEKRENDANLAKFNAKFEAGRQALRERRYTPEGIAAVEKKMEEMGVADHVLVADHLEKQMPPQEVMTPRAFGGFDFFTPPKDEEEFTKKLLESKGNDDNAVLKAALGAIQETRGNTARR